MKDRFLKITSIASLAVSIFLLFYVNELSEKLDNINVNVGNQILNIRSEVGGIRGDVQSYLEEKSNLISSYDWQYGTADYEKHTVPLIFSVTPKKYTKGETQAFLFCGDKEYALQMENGTFKGEIPLDIFGDYFLSKVVFQTGDVAEVQTLDNASVTPYTDVLPNIDIDFTPEYSTRNLTNQGKMQLRVDGWVYINIYAKAYKHSVLSAQLVEYVDGEETGRKDIDLYGAGENQQSDTSNIIEYIEQIKNEDVYSLEANFSVDRSYELEYGKKVTYRIEVRDARGYLYESEIFKYTARENGSMIEDRIDSIMTSTSDMNIYDADGKLLRGEEKS